MMKIRFLLVLVLAFSMTAVFIPVTSAQTLPPSAGCLALNGTSVSVDPVAGYTFTGYFDGGDTVFLVVSGAGSTVELNDATAATLLASGDVGKTISAMIPSPGTIDLEVMVAGADDTTEANFACTPADENTRKVELCHMPPGNPDNAHTIRVGGPALAAHLAHGDESGRCPDALESMYENVSIGIVVFVFESDDEIILWGGCAGDECFELLVIDLTELEDGLRIDTDVEDSEVYVVLYLLTSPKPFEHDFDVYQVNIYDGEDNLVDDNIVLLVNEDGEVVCWDVRSAYDARSELPAWCSSEE